MKLILVRIVKESRQRAYSDNRRVVNVTTAEYRGEDGGEYRKTFESYSIPIVPESGDNKALTGLRVQWVA